MLFRNVSLTVLCMFLHACGSANKGDIQIFVQAEDTIPNGVQAGSDEENIQDGWSVDYDTFIVTVGGFRANSLKDNNTYVVDLRKTPASGMVVKTFDNVDSGRYTKFGYDIARTVSSSLKTQGLSDSDYESMLAGGYALWVAGTFSHPEKGNYTFSWKLDTATSFDDCASEEGDKGFAVPEGGSVAVKPTIHGDHWVFASITRGSEAQVKRLGNWMHLCDTNGNKDVTLEELQNTPAALVFPSTDYSLSGSFGEITTALDYLKEQARSLGDYQGEGECPTRNILH